MRHGPPWNVAAGRGRKLILGLILGRCFSGMGPLDLKKDQ
jgi:hypothetical protein